MPHLGTLDELGIRRITDKSSLQHDYLDTYERLFAPFRDAPITLLEIGVFNGASLKLWEDYFPRATIVGVDIDESCAQYAGGRRIVEIASQADAEAMAAVSRKFGPSIVIDDGSHQADHILTTFQAIYPTLLEGGIYIVEDLAMHAGAAAQRHRGSATISPQQYFLSLANSVCCREGTITIDGSVVDATQSVEYFYCLAVIKKKASPDPNRLEARRTLVGKLEAPLNWSWLSGYILRNGGATEDAIEAAKRAVAMAPHYWGHYSDLIIVLEFAGRLDEALAAAKEVARLLPNHPPFAENVRRIASRIEDQQNALQRR